jgi:hypothetical protein
MCWTATFENVVQIWVLSMENINAFFLLTAGVDGWSLSLGSGCTKNILGFLGHSSSKMHPVGQPEDAGIIAMLKSKSIQFKVMGGLLT